MFANLHINISTKIIIPLQVSKQWVTPDGMEIWQANVNGVRVILKFQDLSLKVTEPVGPWMAMEMH